MAGWQDQYKAKVISLDEALQKVKDNDQIICGLGAGESRYLMRNLHKIANRVRNVVVTNCLPVENYEFFKNPQYKESFITEGWFYSAGLRKAHPQGNVRCIPQHLHLALSKRLAHRKCNIFMGVATPPDKHGNMSLSLSVTYEKELIRQADLVILEVNDQFPRTFGDSFISVSDVDFLVEHSEKPPILPNAEPDGKDLMIGKYIAEMIEDDATIQLGIGGIPNAVARELLNKKNLGVHTEMFVDSLIDLVEAGVINGRKKTLYPGKIVCTFALGTQRLYDYLDDNTRVLFKNGSWTNDPYVVGQNYKQISINGTIEVDLGGQCCSESIGPRQFSGTGGNSDTAVGAQLSSGGKSFMALHSTTEVKDPAGGGTKMISKIVPMLTQGAVVALSRNDVDFVVTEYGVAALKGTTVRERVKRLTAIAHPDFRPWLLEESERLMLW